MAASSELMEKLQRLGLTESECKAYLTILKLGTCTAVELSRESHLQRTQIYALMSALASKGLIEETVDRPKRYRPADVKHALPQLALRIQSQLDAIAKESGQLAAKLEGLAALPKQTRQEEVRVLYGPHAVRANLLESAKSAKVEFWGLAGRRRPPHISSRFLFEGLQALASRGVKTRVILEIDRENIKRVRKMTAAAQIAHYEPIPVYMYGVDDRVLAVSLVQEPASRATQAMELVTNYRPTVQVMQQFFNILWRESTPFALREAILLGRRPLEQSTRVTRGRDESYIQAETVMSYAKEKIMIYVPSQFGPVRFHKGLADVVQCAHRRGVRVRAIFRLCDDNSAAIAGLAKFIEVRHTDNSIGFGIGIVDDVDASLFFTDADSKELESSGDYNMHITSKRAIRHFESLFEELWAESIPVEPLLEKYDTRPETSKPPR